MALRYGAIDEVTIMCVCCITGAGESWPWTLQALSIVGIPVTIVATKLMVVKGPRFIFRLSYISIIAAMVVYIAVYLLNIHNPFWIFIIASLVYQSSRYKT